MKKVTYKCYKCKEFINDNDLMLEPKKDRKGNIKPNEYHKIHIECYEKKEKEWLEWCELYEYIKAKYFNVILPDVMIKELKSLRNSFNYKVMKDCFEYIETSLVQYVSKINFQTDFSKSRYIMAALKNNIDKFYADQKDKEAVVVESDELILFDYGNIDVSKYKNSNNFDILD